MATGLVAAGGVALSYWVGGRRWPTYDLLTDHRLMAANRLELPVGFDPRLIGNLPG